MGTRPARFSISYGPQVIVVKKTADPEALDFHITKNQNGQLVVTIKEGSHFTPFWGETVELLRIDVTSGSAVVKEPGSD